MELVVITPENNPGHIEQFKDQLGFTGVIGTAQGPYKNLHATSILQKQRNEARFQRKCDDKSGFRRNH